MRPVRGTRDDLETTAFLDKEAFKQIRRPDGAPMRHRESQVGDAGFEVIHEACDRAVVFAAVVGIDADREFARDGPAGCARTLKSGHHMQQHTTGPQW
jgi:hypothetical protein